MTRPELSILLPGLAERPWRVMYAELQRQKQALPAGSIELLTRIDAGEQSSGLKRQHLLWQAQGRYVAFVDDDDRLEPDYLATLLAGCRRKSDVVTFCLQLTRPGKLPERWQFGLHEANRRQGLMQANHLCAWRIDLARKIGWCPDLGYADDQVWYQPLLASGEVREELHVNRVLYHYEFHPAVTVNQQPQRVAYARSYVGDGLRCFRDKRGEILIETRSAAAEGFICVRDARNIESSRAPDELTYFHTIRID